MAAGWRRIFVVTGMVLLLGPLENAVWHHSLWGVATTVAGCWALAYGLVRN